MVAWLLVCVLLSSLPLSRSQSTNCNYTASDGTYYDLSSLADNGDYSVYIYKIKPPVQSTKYVFGICKPLTFRCPPPGNPNPETVTVVQVNNDNGPCIASGRIPPQFKDHVDGPKAGVTIEYINPIDNLCYGVPRKSVIIIGCDKSGSDYTFHSITEPKVCVFQFNISSRFACPNPNPTPQTCGNYTAKDGSVYNLAPLTRTQDYSFRHNNVTISWNFCKGLLRSTTSSCKSNNIANAAVVELSTSPSSCIVSGYLPHTIGDHPQGPNRGVRIVYINDEDPQCADPRVSDFVISCNPLVEFNLDGTTDLPCALRFDISSKYACPLALGSDAPLPMKALPIFLAKN